MLKNPAISKRRTAPLLALATASLAALITLTAASCDGGSSSSADGGTGGAAGKPTAAQLKAACDAVFDKVVTCGGTVAILAPSVKAMTCTDANAASYAACPTSATILTQAQACTAMDCTTVANCGTTTLLPMLRACTPDASTN